ncbi:MAG TPA: hypothetical protein ENO23_08745 [Alphaproteobacteria bacterium]|nr:hypothetical protein [Alphaproteobacteria bacterium]
MTGGRRAAAVRALAPAILVALALPAAAVPPVRAAAEREDFILVLDGSFAEFVMYCELVDGDSRHEIRRREYLPRTYRFAADAVSCAVNLLEERGRVSAELRRGGRVIAVVSQNAVRPVVEVRSQGPWGGARGTATARSIRPRRER